MVHIRYPRFEQSNTSQCFVDLSLSRPRSERVVSIYLAFCCHGLLKIEHLDELDVRETDLLQEFNEAMRMVGCENVFGVEDRIRFLENLFAHS
jgi:hypothetical protein